MFNNKSPVFLYQKTGYEDFGYSYRYRLGMPFIGNYWTLVEEFPNIKEFITNAKATNRWNFDIRNFGNNTQYVANNNYAYYVLKDIDGFIIDPALIEYYYNQYKSEIKNTVTRASWRGRYFGSGHYVFRKGPVEGIRKGRGGPYKRTVRTFAEIRENSWVEYDEDCREYGIKIRGHRKDIPDSWDDEYARGNQKNWKKQRKTQWKAKAFH